MRLVWFAFPEDLETSPQETTRDPPLLAVEEPKGL